MKMYTFIKSYYNLVKGLIVILSGFFLACTDDTFENDKSGFYEEAVVRLSITTPGSTIPRSNLLAITDSEYLVSDIQLLVFEEEGNIYKYKYMVEGQEIKSGGSNQQITSFTALLKSSQKPVKLFIVANSKDTFKSYIPTINTPEEEVIKNIVKPFSEHPESGIPMYGETVLPSLDATKANTITLTMLRAVARVDVEIDLDLNTSKNFTLHNVHIFRGNDKIQNIPNKEAVADSKSPIVTAPSIPDSSTPYTPYEKIISHTGQNSIEKIYLAEAFSMDPITQYDKVTCVVVGGYFNDEKTISYYRADFNSELEGHPFGQVLRNHRYHFKIKGVSARGWETPEEAANNRATLLITEIQTWEDFTTEMFANGNNYLGIASRNVELSYKKGAEKAIYVQATVPYRISWQGFPGTTTLHGNSISNEYFTARIESCPELGSDVSRIVYTTLTENKTEDFFLSQMTVEWSNWRFTVNVKQIQFMTNIQRSIRVLSDYYSTAGHLGSSTIIANGNGMRNILSNADNFSPRGIVNYFAGFDFNLTPARSIFATADGSNDATYTMLSLLYSCDVLYLGNDNRISVYAASKVMEWLNESPNRVLIVGVDAPLTSQNLVRADYNGALSGDADWWYNVNHEDSKNYHIESIFAKAGGFSTVPGNPKNEAFTNGPFGEVTANSTVLIADGYFGYAKTYSENVIPLLTFKNYPDYMGVGINKERRIIYHGDASLFQSSRLPSSGTVNSSNPHAVLWANIWAWIAEQVIWGDKENVY